MDIVNFEVDSFSLWAIAAVIAVENLKFSVIPFYRSGMLVGRMHRP